MDNNNTSNRDIDEKVMKHSIGLFQSLKHKFNTIDDLEDRRSGGTRLFRQIIAFMQIIFSETPNNEEESRFSDFRKTATIKGSTVLNKFEAIILSSRMKKLFEDSDDWESESGIPMSLSTKSIDTDEYVYFTDEDAFYNKETEVLVDFEYDDYSRIYYVNIWSNSHSKLDDLIKEVRHMILSPSPYKGKVVKITGEQVDFIKPKNEIISPYNEEIEKSVAWLTSVSDDEVVERLKEAGLPLHSGLLIEGPPGSGKTTLVRRIIKEENDKGTSVIIFGGSNNGNNVGEIDRIFALSEEMLPCIIVLEDAESIFGGRGDATFSEFLNALDGINNRSGLMVLATTNDSSKIDSAITRPGRLEERAVILGVSEHAYLDLVKTRLSWKNDAEIDEIVSAVKNKAGEEVVTPAMMDAIARRIIMNNFSQEEIIDYINNSWKVSQIGTDYTN